ncbi:hypothetical protein V496_01264 [Pseudogymnoascus sp. VKM F-4515 (FW-2607)]|nr:hypothetical protein V496_01264 [Pseudogymnoascus sp. VKM F-4515 (FW-2607)]KFY77435.1 hypothetical protein V498_09339 [Pseudogymnoascus sp. VKM F-4517 (FW-2822)]
MSLKRSNTRFGFLRATPDSDENGSIGTASPPASPASPENDPPPNKLRKRSLQDREEEPQESRRYSGKSDRDRGRSRFRVPKAIHSEDSSPWERFRMRFDLTLNAPLIICTQSDSLFVALRKFSNSDMEKKLDMLNRIRNNNFLKLLESFTFNGSLYAVFEHELARGEKLSFCLSHYALLVTYPTELQLAVILRQILDGLEYLASEGLEHGNITCENILISTEGSIRIAGQECCRKLNTNRSSIKDIRGVGYVAMELMNKVAVYSGPMNTRDPILWPLDNDASKFVQSAESAHSIDELRQPLLTRKTTKADSDDIKADVYMAEFSVYRKHKICK